MQKNSIKKNYIYNVGYQILSMIAPLITSPYISRVLGADQIGQYSYMNSLVSYFVLFATLGITAYGRREISYVQDEGRKRSALFWDTKALEFVTSGIAVALFLIFALFQEEKTLYFVLTLNLLAVAVDVTWFFQGMEEFRKIVLRNTVFKILNILYIFCFVRKKEDFLLYVLGLSFFTFLGNGSLWIGLRRYVDKPDWKRIRPFRDWKTVMSLFVPSIAIEIYTVLDKTMLGLMTGASFENGYYEQAIKIAKMALTIVTALAPVMIPRIGYYFQRKDWEHLQFYLYHGYRFVWFLGIPLCLGMIGCAYHFVPWFFGAGFDKVSPLLCVLSLLILAIGINNLTGVQYLIPTKRQNLFTFTVLIGAAVNFTMNLILIPGLKSFGAAIASVAAESVIALVQLFLVRKEVSVWKVFASSVHYWAAGIVMLGVLLIERHYLPPSFFSTCLLIASGGLVYLIMLIIQRDDFLLENIQLIQHRIIKKNRRGEK